MCFICARISAREFVMRVPMGQALFGMDGSDSVIAAGGPDTRVLATTQARFFELGSTAPHDALVGELFGAWVAALYTALTASTPLPQAQTILEPDESYSLNDGSIARPLEGVLSIQLDSGKVNWLGNADMKLEQGARIPLSSAVISWRWAAHRFLPVPSSSLWEAKQGEAARNALDVLHTLVLRALAQRTTKEITAEQTRLAQKEANDAAGVQSAFSEFAHVLEDKQDPLELTPPAADVLFDTCVRVAEASHIQLIKSTVHLKEEVLDPLGEITRTSRIATRRVHLKGEWWRVEGAPLLAYRTADKQPCALLWEHKQYLVVDAAVNTRQVVTASLAAGLDEYAVMFYRPFADGVLGWKELLRFGATGKWAHSAFHTAAGNRSWSARARNAYRNGYTFQHDHSNHIGQRTGAVWERSFSSPPSRARYSPHRKRSLPCAWKIKWTLSLKQRYGTVCSICRFLFFATIRQATLRTANGH